MVARMCIFLVLCCLVEAFPRAADATVNVDDVVKGLKKTVAELSSEVKEQKQEIAVLTSRLDKLGAPVVALSTTSTRTTGGNATTVSMGDDFVGGFLSSISMIIVSELGDKTFFIAAIMAMRHSRRVIFLAAIAALAIMTVLSAAMGFALPNLMPRKYTHYTATVLFVFFGFRLLYDAMTMDTEEENEELKEVEEELAAKKKETEDRSVEAGKKLVYSFVSPVFIQCFIMTFLAEWGDRSQIATIALAAHKDPYGVTVGGVIGHALCTCLAVVGGKLLATSISERAVAIAGGLLFLLFAAHSVYAGVE